MIFSIKVYWSLYWIRNNCSFLVKAVVSSEYPDFTIVENEPLINNSFVFKKGNIILKILKFYKVYSDDSFPRLGSFEITYKNKVKP